MAFFDKMSSSGDENWWLPAAKAIVLQLRLYAYSADFHEPDPKTKNKHCNSTIAILQKYFQKMIIARADLSVSKKMGCLFVVVQLFKIYFTINNLRLCNNLVNTVNSKNFPPLHMFPRSETVSYNYYVGRLKVFEESYKAAETALDYSLSHCHRTQRANKRRVLQFLIPVKLLLGKLPKGALLEKYGLFQFSSLVDSIRTGNLKEFNEALVQHQDFFIKKGIFLLLEKMKLYVYRNLFNRVRKIWEAAEPEKGHMLPIEVLQKALVINGIEMDGDELECIIANLIYDGYIKGYIAHKRCVVLKKGGSFPPLQQVISS